MKKSVKILLIVCSAVLLTAIIGVAIWAICRGLNNDAPPAETPTEDIELSGVIRYYSVNFDYPDSMTDEDRAATYLPSETLVESGNLVYMMPTPQRDGYTFSGWYYDSDLTMAAQVSDVITKNVTLYPKMVPAGDESSEGSINYVSSIDVSTDFRITVKAPSAEAVQNGLSFVSVHEDKEMEFTLEDNGDGTYTVLATEGLKEGKTYQLYAKDREEGIQSDGRVPSDDEYILFIHDGNVQKKEVIYYNIFTYREEVSRLRIDGKVQFIDLSSVSGFDMESASGLYKVVMAKSGGVELVNNDASGTFTYSGEGIPIGSIIAIHDGEINTEEHTVVDGDVSYVEIIARDGDTYTYVSASATEVVFLPDVIPIPSGADIDDDESTITVNNSLLDFSMFENRSALNKDTTVDVDDYIALYDGSLGETTNAQYFRITKVESGEETTVLTVASTTLDDIKESLDTYTVNGIDMTISEEEGSNIENLVLEQAQESGFAEKAVQYVLLDTLGFDEEVEYGKSYQLSSYQVEQLGYSPDVEAGNISWQIKVNLPKIDAQVTNSLEKVTQVNKATGLRVAFGVTIPIGLEKVENGTRVIESYNLDLYVAFEQEVAFNTKFSVDVQWDNWCYIVWWIDEVVLDATFEMGTYTGVGAVAYIYTEKYNEKSYIWNELVEGTGEKSASGLATRLNKMLKDGNLSFFEGKSGESLADEYAKMLEKNVDYVDILALRLYHTNAYADPKTRIVNYVLDVELVFAAKLNVTMGASFENLTVKQYSFHMRMFDGKATSKVVDKQTPYTNFNFFIMGNVGLRAGIRTTFSVGLISVKLDNLGIMAEVGVYVDLYGFFYFHYDWDGATNKSNIQSGGGLYAAMGIYMDLDFFGGVLYDLASFNIHLYENEWELWNSGNQMAIVAPWQGSYDFKMSDKSQSIPTYYLAMKNMDMTTGKIYQKNLSYADFTVTVADPDKFTYNASKGTVTVTPEQTDLKLSTTLTFTYNKANAAFSKEPLCFTVNVSWEKTEPYRRIYYNYLTFESEDGCLTYGTLHTVSILEGTPITGLPQLTTEREGYDFVGWQISCSALPEYDGKLLSEVNSLEGVNMPNTYISLIPAWKAKNDVPLTVRHYVTSTSDSTKYELYKEETVVGTPGGKCNAAVLAYFLDEPGLSPDYSELSWTVHEWDGGSFAVTSIYVLGNGTSTLDLYYDRAEYRISINANNPEYTYYYEDSAVKNYTIMYGEEIADPGFAELSIPGYTFKGWSTTADGSSGIIDELPETMPFSNDRYVSYYAIWEGESTGYVVNYYLKNAQKEYELVSTEEFEGIVGDKLTSSYLDSEDEVFDWASVESFYVYLPDGTPYTKSYLDNSYIIYIDVYYTKTYYQVLWNWRDPEYYGYGDTVTFPDCPKEGYTFVGWESVSSKDTHIYPAGSTMTLMERSQHIYEPVHVPNTDTPYVVKHVREDLFGSLEHNNSMYIEIEYFTGTTDENVTPAVKTYSGYKSPYTQTVTVLADGTTEVVYLYERQVYYVDIDKGPDAYLRGYPVHSYTYGDEFSVADDEHVFIIEREGYNHIGFYIEGDESQTLITYPYTITGDILFSGKDIKLIAVYEEAYYEYAVEHYIEQLDGTFALQQTNKYSSLMNVEITAPAADFPGFTLDTTVDGSVVTGIIESSSDTLTFKLYYTRNAYDVTWYAYDGETVLATTQVKYQDTITMPTDSETDNTRAGYTFAGWQESASYGTMGTSGASFSSADYGEWTANTYTVTFNANGGSGSMENQSFAYDVLQKLTPNTFTRAQYVFTGWSLTQSGEVVYTDQTEVKNLAASGTVMLYAVWVEGAKVDYTVEHYLEDLDGNGYTLAAFETQSFTGTDGDVVNATSVTIAGFTYDSSAAGNIISGTLVDGETLTLKLYYTRNSYELTFDFNGESMKQAVTDEETYTTRVTCFDISDHAVTVKYGASIADEIAKVDAGAYAGYTFGGWGEYSETMPAENITLTAEWTPISFNVIYNPGGEWWGDVVADTDRLEYTYNYGDIIEAPDVNFTSPSNIAICGWLLTNYEATQGSFVSFDTWPIELVYGNFGDWFTESMYENGEYVIYLMPFWGSDYTNIVFNGNGGTGSMNDQTFERYAGGGNLAYNSFVKDGYEFVGWNTAEDGTGDSYEDGGYFYPVDSSGVSEVILYAQWEKIS